MKNWKLSRIVVLLNFLVIASCQEFYKEVQIGNQVWMVENLNIDKFQNGDLIPEAKTKQEWILASENKKPAWCCYGNDPRNCEKYGKLYNWYAIIDPRGLAPEGWRIPSSFEWRELYDYLDPDGNKEDLITNDLKNEDGIIEVDNDLEAEELLFKITYQVTKGSGFQALPGGYRDNEGNFIGLNNSGDWWQTDTHPEARGGGVYLRCLKNK